jgi:hypothetical protein
LHNNLINSPKKKTNYVISTLLILGFLEKIYISKHNEIFIKGIDSDYISKVINEGVWPSAIYFTKSHANNNINNSFINNLQTSDLKIIQSLNDNLSTLNNISPFNIDDVNNKSAVLNNIKYIPKVIHDMIYYMIILSI